MILTAIISTFGQSAEHRALYVLCVPGFNIGNFTLPFVQSFLGPAGVIATSIFDVGKLHLSAWVEHTASLLLSKMTTANSLGD